jgi:hypothetical protein
MRRFERSFTALTPEDRRMLLVGHLAGVEGIPAGHPGAPRGAGSAGPLLRTPRATDLCYGRLIRKETCRGLAGVADMPPLLESVTASRLPSAVPASPPGRVAARPTLQVAAGLDRDTDFYQGILTMARIVEADICIIGGGITAAMVAEKVSQERNVRIVVVEAGDETVPLEQRAERRQRTLDYGENPWLRDHIEDQTARGMMSRTMGVGGLAMHWGGTVPRFTPEDFRLRSLYGVGDDWPVDYDTLEPFYQEGEERIGVAGHAGPPDLNPRSKPFPMPGMPLSWNLERLKEWGERSGIPFWGNPVAKATVPYDNRNPCQRCDTCQICPTGAKYTPTSPSCACRSGAHGDDDPDSGAPPGPGRGLRPHRPGRGGGPGQPRGAGPFPGPDLRPGRRLHLESPPPAPVGRQSVPRRAWRIDRDGGALHDGTPQCGGTGGGAHAALSRACTPGTASSRPDSSGPDPQEHYIRHDLRIWESTVGRTPASGGTTAACCWGTRSWRTGGPAPPIGLRRGSGPTTT